MQQPEAAGSSAAGQPQPAPAPPPRRSSQDIMHALAHARQAQQAEQAQEAHGAGSPAEADAAAHRALAAALRALASPRQHHHQQQQLSPPAPAPWQVPRCQQQLLGAGSEGYTSCRSSLDCEQSSRPALPLPPDATIQGHSMAAPRPGPGHRLQQAAEASGPKHLDGVRQALGEAGSGLPTEHALRGTVAGRLLGLQ